MAQLPVPRPAPLRRLLALALLVGLAPGARAEEPAADRGRQDRAAEKLDAPVAVEARAARRETFQPNPLRRAGKHVEGDNRFAVIGDAGTREPAQGEVASALRASFERSPFARLLMLGDNVYSNGERENFDASLAYYAPLIERGVRALGILGNHDIRTSRGEDQLAYLGIPGKRYYKQRAAGGKVELFFIDTTVYIPDQKGYEGQDAWRSKVGRRQLRWLKQALAASKAEYKVVLGHHPLYSSGGNGKSVQGDIMRETLGGLLRDQHVALYLAGHDHHYERFRPVDGVTHIVSGNGGGRPDRYQLTPPLVEGSEVLSQEHQFMTFEVKDDGLHFRSIGASGKVLDQGVIGKPR